MGLYLPCFTPRKLFNHPTDCSKHVWQHSRLPDPVLSAKGMTLFLSGLRRQQEAPGERTQRKEVTGREVMTVLPGGGVIGRSLGCFMNIVDAPPCQVSAAGPQDPMARCSYLLPTNYTR